MIELSEPMQQALDKLHGEPLRVVDPRTKEIYVVLPASQFEKLKAFVGDELPIREAYSLMDEVARKEGWDDPEWESYDIYAREQQP